MKFWVTAALVGLLVGCGSTDAGSDGELVGVVSPVEPADEQGFLDGVAKREPDRVAQIDRGDLLEFGRAGCDFSDGYVSGTSPSPTDRVAEMMVDAGYDDELAGKVASDIRSAADGTLCTRELVETSG